MLIISKLKIKYSQSQKFMNKLNVIRKLKRRNICNNFIINFQNAIEMKRRRKQQLT